MRIEPVLEETTDKQANAVLRRPRAPCGWLPDIVSVIPENTLGNYVNNLAQTHLDEMPGPAA